MHNTGTATMVGGSTPIHMYCNGYAYMCAVIQSNDGECGEWVLVCVGVSMCRCVCRCLCVDVCVSMCVFFFVFVSFGVFSDDAFHLYEYSRSRT